MQNHMGRCDVKHKAMLDEAIMKLETMLRLGILPERGDF
jgi:hypothetical protein